MNEQKVGGTKTCRESYLGRLMTVVSSLVDAKVLKPGVISKFG